MPLAEKITLEVLHMTYIFIPIVELVDTELGGLYNL